MNNLKALKAHKGVVRDVCFSPTSSASKLASCSDDHTVSVWDVEYSKVPLLKHNTPTTEHVY